MAIWNRTYALDKQNSIEKDVLFANEILQFARFR